MPRSRRMRLETMPRPLPVPRTAGPVGGGRCGEVVGGVLGVLAGCAVGGVEAVGEGRDKRLGAGMMLPVGVTGRALVFVLLAGVACGMRGLLLAARGPRAGRGLEEGWIGFREVRMGDAGGCWAILAGVLIGDLEIAAGDDGFLPVTSAAFPFGDGLPGVG